uniref:VWFA domain-containing protein n=1 Tax=Gouania willdenowi TaxID=441366 RepID=A0A8C5DBC7_GOUWI
SKDSYIIPKLIKCSNIYLFADIVFLVDSSISSAEFSRFRNTLVQTIIQHNVGASANRIGLAQYGAEVNVEFQLNTFQTKQETLNAARRFKLRPQPGRPTNLGSALRFAEEGLFSSGAGGRAEQGARQILVLVAGKDSDDPVVEAGRMLKAAGVTVLGVGDEAASENLNEFAHFVVDSLKVPRLKQILSEPVEEVTHGCKGANLADIVFIVEESTSIGHVNFQLIRTFLSSIVSGLVISPDKVQVGLVSYSDEPEVQFYLDTFREKAELLQFINILPYHGGKTNTGAALNFTLDNVFTEQRGSRRGVQKVAVVITEGKSQDEVSQAAIKLRRAGITLYGVGIRDFNEAEMAEMVSQPLYKHVYTVDSFTRLKPLREILQKNLCNNIIHNVIAHSRSLTEIQEACVRTDEADIFFLIDDSGSISNPDFYDMQKFVISFLHTFNIGPQNVRIGLVKYSDSPTLEFDLSTYTDAKSMEKAVLKILHEGGGTETGKALSVMGPYFEKAKGSRDHTVPQYLIVVTDGESTDKVKAPAEQLRAQDIIVYAVGVKDSNQTELDQISGDPKRTFVVSNFDALKSIQQEIVTDICSPVACENVPSDIIFLTDSSESIKEEDFTKMKEFIKSIVDRSNVSPDQVHVGLMQFSSNHHLEFDLKRYDSKQDVLKAIDTMEQINLGTRTGQAITAVSQYFHASAGGRPHLKQRLVVITDGESKDDVKIPAEQLRQLGVIIYAIGVEEANSTQLLEISGSLDRVFNQRNFDALKELESQLALKFCEDYCKIDSADIIFLVDVSQSSDAQQFSSMRALMKSLVNHTIVGDDLTRIGIIAFSDDTQLKFSLKGSQSKSQIYQTIDRLLPTGQRAFTGAGLEFSLDFFKGKQGGRPKRNVQVLIVLTDEQAMDPEKLQPASNALRANGVTVLSVGVRNSKKEELNIIAGGNASHVFFAKEYKELETVYKDVIPAICNMSKPVCDRTDLVFLLDRSSSIHPNNHRLMVDFVADVVKSFKIGESLARVAVAQFSNEPRDEFYLNTYFSEQDVIKHLGQLLDTGGDTYIGKALRFIRKYFEEVHGSRRGVPRNLVLITDGDSQDSVEEEAQHLRQMGIQILVIAIRNTYDIQLERIAGSSKKLFSVPDFSSLKNIKMDIVDTVCFTETEPKDNCIIDVAIGFDISRSRRPDELLVSGRLAQVLEEVYYSISLVDLCCGSSTPLETNIAFYVVDGEGFPVYDTNFEGYDKDVLRKVMNHTLSQPTFFNTALMTFYQEIQWTDSVGSSFLCFPLMNLLFDSPQSAVADRECCNVTCKCQGPDGERGDPGKQGSKFGWVWSNSMWVWSMLPLVGESQCPSYPTELVFGLDMSEDVTPASFDRQRLALLTLLDGVSVAESNCPSGARVSVVGFSSYTKHLIRFQDHRRKQQLLNAVQNITLETTNQRHLGAAMRFVAHHVFKRVRSGMTMRKVAVFFSDGPTQDPEDIVTAMMEYRALDIVPAVVSLRDASEISQAIKVDDSGNSILTVLRGGDLKEELRTIKSCAICYDPCRRSEACAVIQEPLQPQRVDVDLVLVPGGSREMQADQFTGARQLLASVVEGLEVSPEPGRADGRARVALVQRDQVEFGLQSFQKREMMRDRLLELEQRPGSSESGQALDLALTRVLLKAPAPRRRKALLVVESAAALGDQDRLHRVSLRAKCQRVALFVVTVGDGYNRTQVEDLAGLPVQQHLIHVSSLKPEQQEYTRRFFRVFLSALHSKRPTFLSLCK